MNLRSPEDDGCRPPTPLLHRDLTGALNPTTSISRTTLSDADAHQPLPGPPTPPNLIYFTVVELYLSYGCFCRRRGNGHNIKWRQMGWRNRGWESATRERLGRNFCFFFRQWKNFSFKTKRRKKNTKRIYGMPNQAKLQITQ